METAETDGIVSLHLCRSRQQVFQLHNLLASPPPTPPPDLGVNHNFPALSQPVFPDLIQNERLHLSSSEERRQPGFRGKHTTCW